jgi:hypothetical protein
MQPVINSIIPPAAILYYISATAYICRMKILMVCLGNICRSPLAEGILLKKLRLPD